MSIQEQIDRLKQMPEVEKVETYPGGPRYFVQYQDGSASFLNENGKPIKTPMRGYDVIRDFRYLGDYHDVPHFAFKGTNFETKMHSETHIFDAQGNEKLFRNPHLYGQESVFEVQKAFDRLKLQGWVFLQDVGERQARGMRR